MKKNLLISLKKNFSKTVQIPPKLRNDSKRNIQKGVYKYERYLDNPRDEFLHKEKTHYNNLIETCSKRMIYNHFNMNQTDSNKDFFQFYNYISNNLNLVQLNNSIKIIEDIKAKLESKDIGKTENLFQFLLSKLYNLTDDRSKLKF